MKISDMISMCFKNLWRRKGRTFLTVIGVIIGCCAIIVMISLGLGMNAAMDAMLANWGDLNAVTIYSGRNMYVDSGSSDQPVLNDDALMSLKAIEHVETVFPKIQVSGEYITLSAGKNDRYKASWMEVYGVDFNTLKKMNYEIDKGAFPEGTDTSNTIIFGAEAAYQFRDTKKRDGGYIWKEMLPDGTYRQPWIDPMTDTIKLSVNNSKKQNDDGSYQSGGRGYEHKLTCSAVLMQDPNWETVYSVMIDIGLAKQLINDYNRLNGVKNSKEIEYSQIKLWVDDIDNVDAVQEAVEAMGFSASSMAQMRKEMQGQLMIIQLVLGGLAAISLLVAAIGIANTMIMSIYERTREIGIMKVLGCFISNIRIMFLMEAGMIGLLGGGIGVLISYIISFFMNKFGSGLMADMMGTDGSTPISIIPLWLVLLALIFSSFIGLISGFYPANRAVKISALEAIKNE
ncbi:MAG: ABC transporter permease [Ruminococcus sp.]|nr:ABC transporter permease [Ruminococcus sp.]